MRLAARARLISLKLMLWIACAIPVGYMWRVMYSPLATNKLDLLLHTSGQAALILLLVSMGLTPLRAVLCRCARRLRTRWGKRLSDWNILIRLRRQVGLWCFFYGAVHLFIYLYFDQVLDWPSIAQDLTERPLVVTGWVVFVWLAPLALTSTNWAMRKLGRYWKPLHRSIYFIACLAVAHVALMHKTADQSYVPYLIALVAICTVRLFTWRVKSHYAHDDGMEAHRAGSECPSVRVVPSGKTVPTSSLPGPVSI